MSNLNPLINFNDRPQQEHGIDSAIVQALDSYEAQVPQHLQQNQGLGRQIPHQQAHHHQQQNSQHHQGRQHDHSHDSNHQRLLQQVPIDPSINDSASEKNAAAAVAVAANDYANARNTAQAAVNSSNKLVNTGNANTDPKITKPRVNKPGQKFGAKKKSWVWNWFIQDIADSNVATCDFCGKIIKRLASDKGSPKKLGEHLKTHKIDRNSVNPKRDSMIVGDANRHYFNTINSNQTFKPHPLSNQTANIQQQQQQQAQQQVPQNSYNRQQSTSTTNTGADFTNTNYDKSEFDQSSYSQAKFQKDIMKFLVENKLPLAIVKSPSFRQVIFTLKPEAIPDLNELNHLYSSLLEVIHNEKGPLSNVDEVNPDQQDPNDRQVGRDDSNVDDTLNSSTSGWV